MKLSICIYLVLLSFYCASAANWSLTKAPSAATIRKFFLNEKTSTLYAFGDKKAIYKTNDFENFENWSEIRYNFDSYIREISINRKGHIYILSSDSIFVSYDNGISFSPFLKHVGVNIWDIIFTVDDSLLINTDDGLMKYNYSNNKWEFWGAGTYIKNEGFIYDIEQKDSIVIAANKNKIFRSDDKGKSWNLIKSIYSSFAGNITAVAHLPNGNYLASYLNEGVFLFDSTGKNIKTYPGMKKIYDIVVDDFGNAYALQSSGIYQTKESVFKLNFNDTIFYKYDNNLYFGDAKIGLNIKGRGILIGVRDDGLYFIKNNSDKWTKTASTMNEAFVNYMFTSKNGNLWASVYPNYLYKSTDKGSNWTPVNSFPRDRFDIYLISKMQENSMGHIYVQCKNKVFFTTDDGESWDEINYPTSRNYINSFYINPSDELVVGDDYRIYLWDGNKYQELLNWDKAQPVITDLYFDKMIFIGYGLYRHTYFENSPPTFGNGSINKGIIFDKHNNMIIGDLNYGLSYVSRSDYKPYKYNHPKNLSCLSLINFNNLNVALLDDNQDKNSIIITDSTNHTDISYNLQDTKITGITFAGNKIIAASNLDFYQIDTDKLSDVSVLEDQHQTELIIYNKILNLNNFSFNRLMIYDIQGNIKYDTDNPNELTIDLSDFISGVYFIKIINHNNTYYSKFILQE